jgi:hypothetical protein
VALGEIVAVNLTVLPNAAGLGLTDKSVVELALLTVTLIAELVELSVFVSPEYAAVIECVPTYNVEVDREAVVPETGLVPIKEAPS